MDIKRLQNVPIEKFEQFYRAVVGALSRYGRDDFQDGDFWVLDEHWGSSQVLLHIIELHMLRPEIVRVLQAIARNFPGWEIVVVITTDNQPADWPKMGMYIRAHEIIDGLQREYFPPEFRSFYYEGARPGTEQD